jgi:hypothetical protein
MKIYGGGAGAGGRDELGEERVDLSEPERRLALVWRMEVAAHGPDRRRADRLLVEATRWLRERPRDAVVSEARDELRRAFAPDPEDKVH